MGLNMFWSVIIAALIAAGKLSFPPLLLTFLLQTGGARFRVHSADPGSNVNAAVQAWRLSTVFHAEKYIYIFFLFVFEIRMFYCVI